MADALNLIGVNPSPTFIKFDSVTTCWADHVECLSWVTLLRVTDAQHKEKAPPEAEDSLSCGHIALNSSMRSGLPSPPIEHLTLCPAVEGLWDTWPVRGVSCFHGPIPAIALKTGKSQVSGVQTAQLKIFNLMPN